jgi:hypothetical protein
MRNCSIQKRDDHCDWSPALSVELLLEPLAPDPEPEPVEEEPPPLAALSPPEPPPVEAPPAEPPLDEVAAGAAAVLAGAIEGVFMLITGMMYPGTGAMVNDSSL